LTDADFDAFQERTIELTEMGEEVVVAKEARVVEEVSIGKDVTEQTQAVRDTVRHTEVNVEEVPGETSQNATGSPHKL
jgi:stress response protein YsnF